MASTTYLPDERFGASLDVDRARSRTGAVWSFMRREPALVVALLILALLIFVSIFPAAIATASPNSTNLLAIRSAPSIHHLFGTDELGRDVFSRVIYGTRTTLVVGLLSMVIGVVGGGLMGLAAGYLGGFVDSILMRLSDVMLAFPGMLLALAIIAAAGPNDRDLILAVGIAAIPGYAKLMRNQVRSVKERGFIEASVASGTKRRVIVFGRLLPNAYSPLLGFATLGIGIAILTASSLSFLGLGPAPPRAEWGAMVSDGAGQISTTWWISLFPGLAIALTVLVVGVAGQWLRRHFDLRSTD